MSRPFLVDADFSGVARVIGLLNPASAQDAATKSYVDSAVEGLAWKDSARVATTATVTISGPGASIDGVTLSANDRVLVKNQTDPIENGVYIFNGAAVPMTRSADASTFAELEQAVVSVEEGTSADASYRQTEVNGVVGTDSVVFATFGTAAASASETVAGIAELATQGETDTGTDDARIVTPLKAKSASWMARGFAQDIGDGSATSFNVDHNFGTRDVLVEVRKTSGNYDTVIADVTRTSTNRVAVAFAAAPSSGSYRVLVMKLPG